METNRKKENKHGRKINIEASKKGERTDKIEQPNTQQYF
jgi:hypothetical protein